MARDTRKAPRSPCRICIRFYSENLDNPDGRTPDSAPRPPRISGPKGARTRARTPRDGASQTLPSPVLGVQEIRRAVRRLQSRGQAQTRRRGRQASGGDAHDRPEGPARAPRQRHSAR